MSLRTSRWPVGMPCWTDISTPDVATARDFYAAVLGWTYRMPDDSGYAMAQVEGSDVAGIGPLQTDGQVAWLLYLATDDVDRSAAAVIANGGTIVFPASDVDDLGRMFVAADPTGAVFAAWQADSHIGSERVNEDGTIAWEDLRSSDPDTAQAFYRAVFGLETRPLEMAGPDYSCFYLPGDEQPLGGMGPMYGWPDGTPSHWDVYFAVPDADASVTAALEGGGSVVSEAFDGPFGRMATLADPDGASFIVIQVPAGQEMPDRGL